jgi:hypothetical protein
VPDGTPEGGGGFLELNEIARMNQGRVLGFPYCVYEFVTAEDADWGLPNSAFEAQVDVHYFDRLPATSDAVTGIAPLRAKLDAIRAAFLSPAAFTSATCLRCDGMDWSRNSPAMDIILSKNQPLVGGFCRFVFVIGETIT